jgi:hypothetical protein
MFGDAVAKFIGSTAGMQVWSQLGRYGQDKLPAIFTESLPEDCPLPAIVVHDVGGNDWGCRDRVGAEARMEVQVFGDKSFSRGTLRQLARDLWKLVNRADLSQHLAEIGFEDWGCQADLPQAFNEENGFPAYRIQITVRALSES